jgi:hypothetical protein
MSHHGLPPGVSIESFLQEFYPREFNKPTGSGRRAGTPQDVLRISHDNTTVRACLDAWEHGYFRTWEEAMTACVCYLADQNNELIQSAVMPEIAERTAP